MREVKLDAYWCLSNFSDLPGVVLYLCSGIRFEVTIIFDDHCYPISQTQFCVRFTSPLSIKISFLTASFWFTTAALEGSATIGAATALWASIPTLPVFVSTITSITISRILTMHSLCQRFYLFNVIFVLFSQFSFLFFAWNIRHIFSVILHVVWDEVSRVNDWSTECQSEFSENRDLWFFRRYFSAIRFEIVFFSRELRALNRQELSIR